MLFTVNPITPQKRLLKKTAEIVKDGGLIAYPTDTAYALGCDLMNKRAVENLSRLKGNKSKKQFLFSIICKDISQVSAYTLMSNEAYRLMNRVLPGPYTFILEARLIVPKHILPKRRTLGIRIPNCPICLELLEELDHPLITTTAHLPDGEPFQDSEELNRHWGHALDVIIDGGRLPPHLSSVIDFSGPEPEIIREGAGDLSILGDIQPAGR